MLPEELREEEAEEDQGESNLRWPARGGAPADGALQNAVAEHGRQRPWDTSLGFITLITSSFNKTSSYIS